MLRGPILHGSWLAGSGYSKSGRSWPPPCRKLRHLEITKLLEINKPSLALCDHRFTTEMDGTGVRVVKVGTLTSEQAEIARLTRELARANKRLTTTEAALDIMGKTHALLESLSEGADSGETNNQR